MSQELYSKQILLEALKEAGLPHSYPSLLRYEKKGIIQRPANEIKYPDRSWRFYTIEEIDRIVIRIRKYIKENNGRS